jgi:hypothetical protein
LHVFEKSRSTSAAEKIYESADLDIIIPTLAEACIQAARHSNELLMQVWIEGTLTTFGYFDARYLFSSTIILAISSVIDNKGNDRERLDSAAQLLQYMAKSGNLSAVEFCGHVDKVKQAIDNCLPVTSDCPSAYATSLTVPASHNATESMHSLVNELTAEMVLGQTPMQDFLTQSDISFDLPNSGFLDDNHLFFNFTSEI